MNTIKKCGVGYMLVLYLLRPLLVVGLVVGSAIFDLDWMLYLGATLVLVLWKLRRMVFSMVQKNLDSRMLQDKFHFNYSYDDKRVSIYVSVDAGMVALIFDTNPFHTNYIPATQVKSPRANNFVSGKGKFEGTDRAGLQFEVDDKTYTIYTLHSKRWLSPYATPLNEGMEMAHRGVERILRAQKANRNLTS